MDGTSRELLRGRYRLQSLLGRGGMGSVYRATDESLGRDVAIKIFEASADADDLERQEAEVNVLAGLNHHSIVTLLDAAVVKDDSDRARVYFVMELVEGQDLKRTLAEAPLAARQVAHIGFDLAEGLEYIHHQGVVHRDIKPANIMIVDYGNGSTRARAKLTDFGIAVNKQSSPAVAHGSTTGTAAYLSPEQVRGEPIGAAADIYALGLLLLECFTREMAFPGIPVASAIARLNNDPVIPEHLTPEWKQLIAGMTARDPRERPSASELVLALRQAVISESGRHRVDADESDATSDETGTSLLEEARRHEVLESPSDGTFERITAIAARTFNAPIAIVSVADGDRVWFTSHDVLLDPRTLADPLAASALGLHFFVAVPLHTQDGEDLGTLSVLDYEPRPTAPEDIATLQDLADIVTSELVLRIAARVEAQALEMQLLDAQVLADVSVEQRELAVDPQ